MLFISVVFTGKGQDEKIKFSEYDLSNGLHVILYPNNATPNVLVSLMYHVGSKNEDPSKTGFAHLFEHLMFEGSKNIQRGEFDELLKSVGGANNAYTTSDVTYYFENVPSNELELILWIEAERMYHAKIDTIGVNTQKGVVIEERKQNYDNPPYGTWREEIAKRAYRLHPYQWLTIGNPEHIRNSSFEDIFHFYKTYYVPNNAVLVIAGDFEEKQTREWIENYFATIPRGTLPFYRPDIVEPVPTAEVRDTIYDNIQLPAVFLAYHAPAAGTKDSYAMSVLTQILSGGESAWLKTNVDDKGITAQSALFYFEQEEPGLVYALGIANLGKELSEVETALTAEINKLTTGLVSEEDFQKALAFKEYETANNLQTLSGVASQLAYNYTYFKDAGRVNKELSFYNDLTREDLLRVAQNYFQPQSRVILYYLPKQIQK